MLAPVPSASWPRQSSISASSQPCGLGLVLGHRADHVEAGRLGLRSARCSAPGGPSATISCGCPWRALPARNRPASPSRRSPGGFCSPAPRRPSARRRARRSAAHSRRRCCWPRPVPAVALARSSMLAGISKPRIFAELISRCVVVVQAEDLAVVDALAFEHATRIMQPVGQHMQFGVAPRDEAAVIPDEAVAIVEREHGRLLIGAFLGVRRDR